MSRRDASLLLAPAALLLLAFACGPVLEKPATAVDETSKQAASRPVPTLPPATAAGRVSGARQSELSAITLSVPTPYRGGALARERILQLPPGFTIGVFAAGLGSVRSLVVSPRGDLLATIPREGRIVALRDLDTDGVADGVVNVATGLTCPYGMVFFEGFLYVAQTTQITRHAYTEGEVAVGRGDVVVDGLPAAGCGPHHFRPLAIAANRLLYTAYGSSCNVCVEQDPRRGQVWQFPLDGGEGRRFATGLRNVVDLAIDSTTGHLWGVVNERDQLGDDIPPDMVTVIYDGADYGWPYCYQGDTAAWVVDARVPQANPGCQGLTPPTLPIQAHSAPLGLSFYTGQQFPGEYRDNIFVGLHGSWNRTQGTGFKVVRISFAGGQPQPAQDFATGWLIGPRGPADAWGRPVATAVAPEGSLFVTDDSAGAIYRIASTGTSARR